VSAPGSSRTVGTVVAALAASVAADASRPLLTYYDDAADERTELSGATLGNWVAKTANMLVDACGAEPGGRVAVRLPAHWQTAAVMLGSWSAGMSVAPGTGPAEVGFGYADDADPDWPADDRFLLSLHPLALPMRSVPDGFLDYNAEVRTHGDHFTPLRPVLKDGTALVTAERTWSHGDLIADARDRADRLGISGGRVLVDVDAYPDMRDWLLAPLAAGASVVLCRNLNPVRLEHRAASERVTHQVR